MDLKTLIVIIALVLSFTGQAHAQAYGLASETLYSFGQAFINQGKYFEAKQELEKSLMLNPQNLKAQKSLELCNQKIIPKRCAEMDSCLEKAEKKAAPQVPERIAWALRQGTWQLKKGESYGELYNKFFWSNRYFDKNWQRHIYGNDGKYSEFRSELKLEHGITDRTSLLFSLVGKYATWKDGNGSSTRKAFTEIWPGIRYLLFDKPCFVWLRGRAKLPLSYKESDVPSLGQHQIDGEFTVQTAQPWPELPGYTKVDVGYKLRAQEPPDAMMYAASFGYSLFEHMILEIGLDAQDSLGHGRLDEDWIKGTFGPIFQFGPISTKIGYGNTFTGKNTSAAQEIFLSFYGWW